MSAITKRKHPVRRIGIERNIFLEVGSRQYCVAIEKVVTGAHFRRSISQSGFKTLQAARGWRDEMRKKLGLPHAEAVVERTEEQRASLERKALGARWTAALKSVRGMPLLTLGMARCLVRLGQEPMQAVRSSGGGWRAPDESVGPLIRECWAHYVPPAEPGAPPSYALTGAGHEVLGRVLAVEPLREMAAHGAGGGSET